MGFGGSLVVMYLLLGHTLPLSQSAQAASRLLLLLIKISPTAVVRGAAMATAGSP